METKLVYFSSPTDVLTLQSYLFGSIDWFSTVDPLTCDPFAGIRVKAVDLANESFNSCVLTR